MINDETLRAAFSAHIHHAPINDDGQRMLTRRIVISLAHMADCTPRQIVLRCEALGLAKAGSWEWFKANGGFTREHFQQAKCLGTGRQPREANNDKR